jgi:hypothetical protein
MAVLSLQEAAEQAGTSKVDIWRAVRSGLLPAQRTDDGGFAVDPVELFRVFERRQPEQSAMGSNATASPETLARPETGATPERAATNDIAVAFAALEAELKSLLGPLAEVRANDKQRQDRNDLPAEQVAAPPKRRLWWPRLMG